MEGKRVECGSLLITWAVARQPGTLADDSSLFQTNQVDLLCTRRRYGDYGGGGYGGGGYGGGGYGGGGYGGGGYGGGGYGGYGGEPL
jgi:hypothetical protein